MFKTNSLSIKQKVVLGITFAVLASTVIVGAMAQQQARDVLSHRLIDIELPGMLERINGEIDREVSQLLLAAEQIASNEFISDAIESTDRDPALENKLVKQLNNVRNQYQLNDASVANRQTAYYWKCGSPAVPTISASVMQNTSIIDLLPLVKAPKPIICELWSSFSSSSPWWNSNDS